MVGSGRPAHRVPSQVAPCLSSNRMLSFSSGLTVNCPCSLRRHWRAAAAQKGWSLPLSLPQRHAHPSPTPPVRDEREGKREVCA